MVDAHPTSELSELTDLPEFWDPERRVSDLDDFGIDKQVVTLARPTIWRGMDPDTAIELTRLANDAVSEFCATYPDRFIPVATLPRLDDAFADELIRCVEELDMVGLQLFSNVEGGPFDSGAADQIFSIASKKDLPIWIHPQLHEWHGNWLDDHGVAKTLGWPFDTSVAMTRLVYGGYLDRYDLDVIPHHMGGMIAHFAKRLEVSDEMRQREQGTVADFRKFYADTCRGGDPDVLEEGLDFFGEDNLVFATDYPFGPESGRYLLRNETQAVADMDIDDETRAKVFGGNLRSLIDA